MLASARRSCGLVWLLSSCNVRQHARADGHRTPPLPRGETLAQTEIDIAHRHSDRHGTLERRRERKLHQQRLAAIESGLTEDARSFPRIADDSKAAAHDERLKFNALWRQDLGHIVSSKQDLAHFKIDNLLTRDADNPDPVLALGVASLAFVVETTVNALLFAGVSQWGLAGGAGYAATLSAPNIALGLVAGFVGFRACHDIRSAVRRFGATLSTLTVSTAVAWNLYVGHLRSVAEERAALSQPLLAADWRSAAAQMLADPLAAFQSGPALTLVILGLAVFAIALREGLDGLSDRVPGFSRVDRRYRRALARAIARKQGFFRVLDRTIAAAKRTISRRHRAVHGRLAHALRILGAAAVIINRFNQRLADQLWVHRRALCAYCSINSDARNQVDVPARFAELPLADAASTLPAFDWLNLQRTIQRLSDSACTAAQTALADLLRYALIVKDEIEQELAAVTHEKVLPPPLLLPALEYA